MGEDRLQITQERHEAGGLHPVRKPLQRCLRFGRLRLPEGGVDLETEWPCQPCRQTLRIEPLPVLNSPHVVLLVIGQETTQQEFPFQEG